VRSVECLSERRPAFEDWAKLAARELKDTPVDKLTRDYGGLPIRPAYFPGDVVDPGIPGAEPFTRGLRATMYTNRPWTIRQYAGFSTARESNAFYPVPARRRRVRNLRPRHQCARSRLLRAEPDRRKAQQSMIECQICANA
jgi:methylmalonyl-CoA mutase N-terminal domain/subunit